ncbi:hypothetical protein ACFFUA_15020 [Streptomyces heliomycini]|uniref:Transposase n=1 Tax=Streptomyces heliomycini TaxID=284032 RepID=A0ABV5L9D5_9ACTN
MTRTAQDGLVRWFSVDRSTTTRAVGEVRPLPAERGRTVGPGVRLRTPAEVVDRPGAGGKTGIVDGTGTRVRRPGAGREDRDGFVSCTSERNAVRTTVVTDGDGRVLFRGPTGPGSCADITHAPPAGAGRAPGRRPRGGIPAAAGHRGLASARRMGTQNRAEAFDAPPPTVPGLVSR